MLQAAVSAVLMLMLSASAQAAEKVWVGVGHPGLSNRKGVIGLSKDNGATFKEVWYQDKDSTNVNKVYYSPEHKKFVAVGSPGILVSADGATWKKATWPAKLTSELHNVTSGGGMLVAVGSGSTILYSKDGENWRHVYYSPQTQDVDNAKFKEWSDKVFGAAGRMHYYDIAFVNGKFIVTGSYFRALRLAPSGDELVIVDDTRNTEDPMTHAKGVVSDGKGTVLIVGLNKAFISSDNGDTWKEHRSLKGNSLSAVTHGGGKFVGGGGFSTVVFSEDGAKWTKVDNLHPAKRQISIHDVGFGDGTFVAVARESNELLVSKDGVKWVPSPFKVESEEPGMTMSFTGITFAELQ